MGLVYLLLEAIASRLEAIASRLEAIALSFCWVFCLMENSAASFPWLGEAPAKGLLSFLLQQHIVKSTC